MLPGMPRTLAESIGGTVRQRAVRELRDRVLTGALPPGTRLDLDEISEEFGISRTPVREALLELSFQGLVEIMPRSGVKVLGVSPAATTDNFAILAALSGKAAEWAASRVSPDELAQLERLAGSLAAAESGSERGRPELAVPPGHQPGGPIPAPSLADPAGRSADPLQLSGGDAGTRPRRASPAPARAARRPGPAGTGDRRAARARRREVTGRVAGR